jgi:DNA modification methylase
VTVRIINADVMDGLAQLADESVHCVVTSPPYWGLRDYGAEGQIGLEPTLAEHIDRLVQVFREVRRVLRQDGTLWLNYGDGYAGGGRGDGADGSKQRTNAGSLLPPKKITDGLKPKDLLMMPERLALALQADGWWVRARIIWHKPNPMPESVTDRPTKSHEHIWLLSKAPRYYYDAASISETSCQTDERPQARRARALAERAGLTQDHLDAIRAVGVTDAGKAQVTQSGYGKNDPAVARLAAEAKAALGGYYREFLIGGSRNARDVWTIATEPFPDAHFATFPTELAERCIKAGTSEKGCCAECGAPWVRETKSEFIPQQDVSREKGVRGHAGQKPMDASNSWDGFPRGTTKRVTTGWRPSCTCNADVVPCTVLDPFFGSGTTGLVADRLQRHAIGIELNPEYAAMAEKRIAREAGLFAEIRAESVTPAVMTT